MPKTVNRSIRMSEELSRALDLAAEKGGTIPSEVIRQALRSHLIAATQAPVSLSNPQAGDTFVTVAPISDAALAQAWGRTYDRR
jgi:hypothetical protein